MTTKPIDKIAWDAMVAIDCLQKASGQMPFIVPMIREAEQGRLLIVCSTILRVEVFKVGGSAESAARQRDLIREFFQNEYFQFEPAHDWIADFAQDLCRDFGITTVDSIHVATAVFTRTPILLTRDGTSARRKKLLPLDGKVRHRDPGRPALRIMTPEGYNQMRMRAENPLMNPPEP